MCCMHDFEAFTVIHFEASALEFVKETATQPLRNLRRKEVSMINHSTQAATSTASQHKQLVSRGLLKLRK